VIRTAPDGLECDQKRSQVAATNGNGRTKSHRDAPISHRGGPQVITTAVLAAQVARSCTPLTRPAKPGRSGFTVAPRARQDPDTLQCHPSLPVLTDGASSPPGRRGRHGACYSVTAGTAGRAQEIHRSVWFRVPVGPARVACGPSSTGKTASPQREGDTSDGLCCSAIGRR
jgi:hypothetical protein